MIRIAIVNDSVMAVESLRRVISDIPEYQLLWAAYNGEEAVTRCDQHCPDIILMDLIMPGMDGVETTRKITAHHSCAILVVTAIIDGFAGRVFDAMGAGAIDAVNTPVLGEHGDAEGARSLVRKINAIALLMTDRPARKVTGKDRPVQVSHASPDVPLIAIGASTGGPSALREILQTLPTDIGVSVAIIQHVVEQFSASFINWLNDYSSLPVRAALPGDRFRANEVLVCGRENHLVMTQGGSLDYTSHPAEQVYRPSVDVFFESLAINYKIQSLAVLLTGMGKDGAKGLKMLRDQRWHTIAQDQASCAVYGMPKAAKALDAATEILTLGDIGARLVRWAEGASSGVGKNRNRDHHG